MEEGIKRLQGLIRSVEVAESSDDKVQHFAELCHCFIVLKDVLPELLTVYEHNRQIPVAERMPEPGKPVVAFFVNDYGKHQWSRAVWIPEWFKEDEGDYEGDSEYNESRDLYYWPEGWYEWNHYDDIHYVIHDAIICWREITLPGAGIEDTWESIAPLQHEHDVLGSMGVE